MKNHANLSTTSQPTLFSSLSFPAGMLPETFESRERIGASASQGGKPVRPGRFGPVVDPLGKNLKTPGRVVPRIASIAYQNTQDPRSRDRPSFPPFNSQTRQRAWQRRRALQNNPAWFDRLTMRKVEDCKEHHSRNFCDWHCNQTTSLMVSLSNHAPCTVNHATRPFHPSPTHVASLALGVAQAAHDCPVSGDSGTIASEGHEL